MRFECLVVRRGLPCQPAIFAALSLAASAAFSPLSASGSSPAERSYYLPQSVLSSGGGSAESLRFSADTACGEGALGRSRGAAFAVNFGYYNSFDEDVRPPRTALALLGRSLEAGGKTYINGSTQIILSSEDDLLDVGDAGGFGVKNIFYSIDDAEFAAYSSPFDLSGFPDGLRRILFYAVDLLGTAEEAKSRLFALDKTPPVTTISVGEPKFEAFGIIHISPTTPVTLLALDPTVNSVASSVGKIEYRLACAIWPGGETAPPGDFIVYTNTITLPSGAHTLEYRSVDNIGNVESAKSIALAVTPMLDYAVASVGNLQISGQSKVTGNVAAGGSAGISGNAELTGDITASTVTLTGNAKITGEIKTADPGIVAGALDLDTVRALVALENDNDKIPPTSRGNPAITENGILKLAARDTLTLAAGTYYLKGIEISARARLYFDGKINILLDGAAAIAGQSEIYTNETAPPFDTLICQASTQPVSISGKGRLDAMIYAPRSAVDVTGQGITVGNILAGNVNLTGGAQVTGALERLKKPAVSAPKTAASPKPSGGIYDFALRDAYVYPNPARAGALPKIRLETGAADEVEIKIYNVAAELVAEASLDGNAYKTTGGVCYYELSLDVSRLASGVYLCGVRARKSGQPDINVVKKFAVIK